MDNSLYIGLQTQRALQRRMDATANNLANVNTTGFKADAVRFAADPRRPAESRDLPTQVNFVRDVGLVRDMRQGGLRQTGEPFDVAIEGDGFFTVQGPSGPAFTRDGAFQLNADGQLVTKEGHPVLGQGGPIVIATQGQAPTIDQLGVIRIGNEEVGRLALTNVSDPGALEKIGDNLYVGGGAAVAFDGRAVQGMLENSNVQPVLELTRLIEISRAYESAARIVRNGDETRQRTLERLGRG
jgi:flagellar basal-body rod protein FlgF